MKLIEPTHVLKKTKGILFGPLRVDFIEVYNWLVMPKNYVLNYIF